MEFPKGRNLNPGKGGKVFEEHGCFIPLVTIRFGKYLFPKEPVGMKTESTVAGGDLCMSFSEPIESLSYSWFSPDSGSLNLSKARV